MKRPMWIFSLDALGSNDREYFETLPGFQRIRKEGAVAASLRGVFPTLTYPSHATIVTGRSPRSHGIVNNRRLEPEHEMQEWFWFEKDLQGDSLFRAAKRQGLRIASLLWPVCAGADHVANMGEIFATRPRQKTSLRVLKNSTFLPLLQAQWRFGRLRKGIRQPQLDAFVFASAKFWQKKYDPDLLFVHLVDVDAHKHHYGTASEEVKAAIRRLDAKIQSIFNWAKEFGDVDLVFLSDHSQIDTPHWLYPFDDFEEAGFLIREANHVKDYRACPHSAGGSCAIYLNEQHPLDGVEKAKLVAFLEHYAKKSGIRRVYYQPEIEEQGADPAAFAWLDAEDGYAFSEYFARTERAEMERRFHLANHGFHPDHERYDALFMGVGPSFRAKALRKERADLRDVAPTLAHILDLDLQGAEGRVLYELLEE